MSAVRNIFACLVHKSPHCVLDLVRNLHYLDPDSSIVLYNGSNQLLELAEHSRFEQFQARLHPQPRPIRWGRAHDFALDCMQFALDNFKFDTLTIVDSDQLLIRPGYSAYLGRSLTGKDNLGLLGSVPRPQPSDTINGPPWTMFREIALWRPFFRRFSRKRRPSVYWTFWPSTVFTAEAARALTDFCRTDTQLKSLLARTRIFATEEVILPTLVALLGFEIAANPCSYNYVHFQVSYSIQQIQTALRNPDVFWIHPIPRQADDPLRSYIRARFNNYQPVTESIRSRTRQITTRSRKRPTGWVSPPLMAGDGPASAA